jgi:hypothetical protein
LKDKTLVVSQGRTLFVIRVDKPIKCHVFLEAPEEPLLLEKFLITVSLRSIKKAF